MLTGSTTDQSSVEKLTNLSIAIIPAYNEALTIAKVIEETSKYVTKVVVVDDGSSDDTAEIASHCKAEVIHHERNMGKGAALKTGFEYCKKEGCEYIITIDADAQHDPADIPKLLEPLLAKRADVTIGSRFVLNNCEIPTYRQTGLTLIGVLGRYLTGNSVKDTQSGFRAYNTKALEIGSNFKSKGFGVESEQLSILLENGLKIIEVPVVINYQVDNASKKHPLLHGLEIISTIARLTIKRRPLFTLGFLGIFILVASTISGLLIYSGEPGPLSLPISVAATGLLGFLLVLTGLVLFIVGKVHKKGEPQRNSG